MIKIVDPIGRIIQLWSTKQITKKYAIAKILVWLFYMHVKNGKLHTRVVKMERRLAKLEGKPTNNEHPTTSRGEMYNVYR